MFPPTTSTRTSHRTAFSPPAAGRKASRKRSLRELLRGAVDTAIEFATLGEANFPRPPERSAPPAPIGDHPHRRPLARRHRQRRPGSVPARPGTCLTPICERAPGH